MTFRIAPAPHTQPARTTGQVMRLVCYALIPGALAHYFIFGPGIIIQLLLAIITAVVTEFLFTQARRRTGHNTLADYSAVVTAVLLALSIPSLAPWWIIVIGTVFAIGIVKHLYGGIGQNIFNPAMAGYVVLLVSFPLQMTSWPLPAELSNFSVSFYDAVQLIFSGYTTDGYNVQQLKAGIDGISMATPLDTLKTGLSQQLTTPEITNSPIFSGLAGVGWQWLNAAFLVGGLALVATRVISWHIPAGLILGLAVPALLGSAIQPDQSIGVFMHLFSGATMLGAFFIATDPVSAATSNRGRLYFGLLIGFLVYVIRTWGGYPDGVAFAVLLANMCVPIIDKYSQPTVYGHKGSSS